ncbi:hypothetical protein HDC90_002934 [Pedobacter sp. AK013]|nr:hypothetical protein [Pedobacter sp. AK013]
MKVTLQFIKNQYDMSVYFNESDPSVSGQTGHQFDYRMMRI